MLLLRNKFGARWRFLTYALSSSGLCASSACVVKEPLPPSQASGSTGESTQNPSSTSGQCEDGKTRSCRERENGTPVEFPNGIQGSCKEGTQTCERGHWTKCKGLVAPKQFDTCEPQNDDNCNGRSDQKHCSCINGSVIDCTIRDGIGDCGLGQARCAEGQWQPCIARFVPQNERCGARPNPNPYLKAPTGDEDCDGIKDESDAANNYLPEGGKVYMKDIDGDGWGDIRKSYLRGFCEGSETSIPEKYIPFEASKQTDCGDCENGGALVHPEQLHYYPAPSVCLKEMAWKGGLFDYNCDQREEQEYPKVDDRKCGFVEKKCVLVGQKAGHWERHGGVPKCGLGGRLPSCIIMGTGDEVCVSAEVSTGLPEFLQACR